VIGRAAALVTARTVATVTTAVSGRVAVASLVGGSLVTALPALGVGRASVARSAARGAFAAPVGPGSGASPGGLAAFVVAAPVRAALRVPRPASVIAGATPRPALAGALAVRTALAHRTTVTVRGPLRARSTPFTVAAVAGTPRPVGGRSLPRSTTTFRPALTTPGRTVITTLVGTPIPTTTLSRTLVTITTLVRTPTLTTTLSRTLVTITTLVRTPTLTTTLVTIASTPARLVLTAPVGGAFLTPRIARSTLTVAAAGSAAVLAAPTVP